LCSVGDSHMAESFTREDVALLTPYVTDVEKPIYALKNLPEEVVAVLFAYYSRSRGSLRRNLLKLITEQDVDLPSPVSAVTRQATDLTTAQDKARQFHEKWVGGYGPRRSQNML
jgi:hypothetical protein